MASVVDFVGDQLYLFTAGVFAAASFVIIGWSRRRQPASGGAPLAGLRTAVMASVVATALFLGVVLALGWVLSRLIVGGYYYGDNPAPSPREIDPAQLLNIVSGLLSLISVPGVTFLAVLDLYAIRPPRPEGPARARSYGALGVLISASLLGLSLYIPTQVDAANTAAAARDARAAGEELSRYVEARSAGLSIDVAVVDVGFGAATKNGWILEHLTLDISLRSATAIALRQSDDGYGSSLLLLNPAYAPDAGYTPPMYLKLKELPADLPAGFDATFRLEVPVTGTIAANQLQPDPVTTGPWSADLMLDDRSPEPARITSNGPVEPYYVTSTTFAVSAR